MPLAKRKSPKPRPVSAERKAWAIRVAAWGTLYALGTEAQAEEWRRHKANWEQCVASKREATAEEIARETFKDLADLLGEASKPARRQAGKAVRS